MNRLYFFVLALLAAGFLPAQTAKILPDQFLRAFDPVTVQYEKDVGPQGGGPADGPGPFLNVSPAPSGEYRWLDSRTIQFLPAAPWPALRTVTVSAGSSTRRLATLLAPPRSIVPGSGSLDLEPIEKIEFTFDGALPLGELKQLVKVEVRPLPGLSDRGSYTLADGDFQLTELEARQGTQTTYRITFLKPLGYGLSVGLQFRLSNEPSLAETLVRYTFGTKPPFTFTAFGSGPVRLPVPAGGAVYRDDQAVAAAGGDALSLEFSEALDTVSLETLKNLVSFEPTVKNLEWRTEGNRLILKFGALRQTPYRMTVKYQALRSITGRLLAPFGKSALTFYLPKADPYLTWRTNEGLVERFGPQYLPLEGRGVGKVDLRIYPIDPLSRNFWPFPAEPVVLDESVRPPRPGLEPDYGTKIQDQIRMLPAPPVSKVVDLPVPETSGQTRFGLDLGGLLAGAFGPQAPGTYLVGYRLLGSGSERHYVRVTVTDLSLSVVEEESAVLLAVTSLKTGQPVPGADVKVEGFEGMNPKLLFEDKTDARGFVRHDHTQAWALPPGRIVVTQGSDTLVVNPGKGMPVFSNNHWSDGDGYWLSWLADKPREEKHKAAPRAYLLTERPIYKPEEVVHFIGWAKDRVDGALKAYGGPGLEITVRGPSEDQEWSYDVTPNAFGRFSFDFSKDKLLTGEYKAELSQKTTGLVLAETDFKKQAYRVPSFKVNLTGPDLVPLDRPFEVLMTADYYSGGRLIGDPVKWTVNQYPYSVTGPQFPGYLFSTDEQFSQTSAFGNVGSGTSEAKLDPTGAARLSVNPSAEPDGRARRYVVTGVVSGADRQTVTQVKQVVALPPFILGIRHDRLVTGARELTPDILVLDHQLKPLAGVPVTLRVLQRQWHSYISETDFTTGEARYANDTVDLPVFEKTFPSESTATHLKVPVDEAGVYVVEISSRDFLGRQVVVRTDTFLSGNKSVAWPRKTDQVFEMTADKLGYNPGDTARILVKSPYQEARALVVIEGPQANSYRWVDVHLGQGLFEVPIDGTMAPVLPMAALLIRGRIDGDTDPSRVDLAKPASVGASLRLGVIPRALQANLTLNHDVETTPGGKMKIDLNLADPDGNPLDGEVSLWLVDQAVLSLGKEKRLDPLPAFLPPAQSWIRISDLRNLFLGRIPVEEVPGGDGSDSQFLELVKKTTVRRNFKTVPYFNAGIPIVSGKASVEFTMPDNLTDFAVRGVAVTTAGRFGSAKSIVSVRLPVLAQSALPRFLRPGDKTLAGGTGRVAEGKGGPALTGIKLKGVTTDGPTPGQASRAFVLDDVKAESLRFPLNVAQTLPPGSPATVELFLNRNSDGASDAFAMDIPVRPDTDIKTMVKDYTITTGNLQPLDRPSEGIRKGSLVQSFLVGTDLRVLSYLRSLNYLAEYPHGCAEQRTSQLYPSVLFKGMTNLAGVPGAGFPDQEAWTDYFNYLVSCQDDAGLWGFWPGSKGSVFLTSYILEFLAEVQKAGIEIPKDPVKRAGSALEKALRSDSESLVGNFADYERVEALAALDAGAQFNEAYAKNLLDQAQGLPLYSQARLYTVLAAHKLNQGSKADRLLKNLRSAVTLKSVGGTPVFPGIPGTWGSYQTVLVTETRTAAALAVALKNDGPSQNGRNALVNWLLARSGPSGWGSTLDTVVCLRALGALLTDTAWARTVDFQVSYGTKTEKMTLSKAKAMGFTFRSDDQPTLTVTGASEQNPFYVVLTSQYVPPAPGSSAPAENKGFSVTREWFPVNAANGWEARIPVSRTAGLSVTLGKVVEEHVQVVNFQDQSYVAVSVPLAAGFEPLNPALATSGPEAKPTGPVTLPPSYSAFGDDQVVFYYNSLPHGTFDFSFRVRADFEGTYTQPRAKVELMYDGSVYGTSDGAQVKILPAP